MNVNFATWMFLLLALFSMLWPLPPVFKQGQRVCVKAFIGSRMFNKHMNLDEIPHAGDHIRIEDYVRRVEQVHLKEDGALIFLESEPNGESAKPALVAAGFEEFVIRK